MGDRKPEISVGCVENSELHNVHLSSVDCRDCVLHNCSLGGAVATTDCVFSRTIDLDTGYRQRQQRRRVHPIETFFPHLTFSATVMFSDPFSASRSWPSDPFSAPRSWPSDPFNAPRSTIDVDELISARPHPIGTCSVCWRDDVETTNIYTCDVAAHGMCGECIRRHHATNPAAKCPVCRAQVATSL